MVYSVTLAGINMTRDDEWIQYAVTATALPYLTLTKVTECRTLYCISIPLKVFCGKLRQVMSTSGILRIATAFRIVGGICDCPTSHFISNGQLRICT